MDTGTDWPSSEDVQRVIGTLSVAKFGIGIGPRDLVVRSQWPVHGERTYVIIALRDDLKSPVSNLVSMVKHYIPNGTGVWLLTQTEARRLVELEGSG